ncbi:YchJ family protein [Telmatospirillum sp.]|uniref:YchJ family protein n=1 Tax=Telmatospirillum sp. TaxID=2079197 RepID=UPI00283CD914|nr:YchJ family protein [Telmatospirillum sp.]MDR3440092.1 YchJ family protein [Telmatospirillum sp.]
MTDCPCGSSLPLESCCGPILAGAPAATPEALMRSRYTAYVLCDIDHLERSLAQEALKDHDRKAAEQWAKSVEWLGLSILGTEGGSSVDQSGTVEFTARFRQNGAEHTHHETSSFRRQDGKWVYVDGKIHNTPVVRTGPKIGRNDPCPCGSGKKYKHCCGR